MFKHFSPDYLGFADDVKEHSINLYYRFRLHLLLILFVCYFIFTGFERHSLLQRINQLEKEKTFKDFPTYVEGVKNGLEFKKNQKEAKP